MRAKKLISRWVLGVIWAVGGGAAVADTTLLNVSYDPTREFYQEYNAAFARHWQEKSKEKIAVKQSHGGSGKQARSVLDGLEADIVTLALAYDVGALAEKKLIPDNWQQRLPQNASPYTSTVVFLVRKGNPKQIKDWDDLVRPGIGIVTPNPNTSGGARWNYLAAWAFALKQPGGNEDSARDFVGKLFRNVKVLDSGARGATTTFAERGIGDVLLAWENEAHLAIREQPGKFEIITPSLSVLAEPPVAIVEKNAEKHGNKYLAQGYLNFLYSPLGQDLAGKHYYRPRSEAALKKYSQVFKPLKLVTVDQEFGGWAKVQSAHFENGGIFDQIVKANSAK